MSINQVEAAEVDEVWSFVGKKHGLRWLGMPLTTGLRRSRRMCLVTAKMKSAYSAKPCWSLLASRFFPDHWGAYARHLVPETHVELKPLTLRARVKHLVRKTICFSKVPELHDVVIGLFVNRYEFGLTV